MSIERIENGVKLSEMYTHSDYTLEQRKNVYGRIPIILSWFQRGSATPLRTANFIKSTKPHFKISTVYKKQVTMQFTISSFINRDRTLREIANTYGYTYADKIYDEYMSDINDDF